MTWITRDDALLDELSSRFDLRKPNDEALREIVEHIQQDEFREVVCDLATGVGKTYISAALIEYLARQGKRNILIVTPGRTIQEKTISNFTVGHAKYIPGGDYRPTLITAENFKRGGVGDALHDDATLKLFIFNVQQLTRPSEANAGKKTHELNEYIGSTLYEYLQEAEDLVVIADEHHVYNGQAKVFSAAIRDLKPRALVGLTATPNASDEDKVIYRYSLAAAIADHLVKVPVIAYRRDGQKDETTQLADACHLLRVKEASYKALIAEQSLPPINPVLFVVCQTIDDAERLSGVLAGDGFIGDGKAVLQITGGSSDDALRKLASVEEPGSPIRAVVSVDKLKEGWDVRNIAVIVAFRRLASDTLTEQILGRGLRLPFGKRMGVPMVDQVDVVAHDSYKALLSQKNALIERALSIPAGQSEDILEEVRKKAQDQFDSAAESSGDQGQFRLVSPAMVIDGEERGASTSLVFEAIDDKFFIEAEEGAVTSPPPLIRVPGAPQITFPRRNRDLLRTSFSMDYVSDASAFSAGAAYAEEIVAALQRDALEAQRTIDGEIVMETHSQDSEAATQRTVAMDVVVSDLKDRVANLGLVPATTLEWAGIKRVVDNFLAGALRGAESKELMWGERRAFHAAQGIERLVTGAYNLRRLKPTYVITSVVLPDETRQTPRDVGSRMNDPYENKRFFDGWRSHLLPCASFDAETTEWRLADILDRSARID